MIRRKAEVLGLLMIGLLSGCQASTGGGGGGSTVPCQGAYAGRITDVDGALRPVLGSLDPDRGGSMIWVYDDQEETFLITDAGELSSDVDERIAGTVDNTNCEVVGTVVEEVGASTVEMVRVPCLGSDYDVSTGTELLSGSWVAVDTLTGSELFRAELDAENRVTSLTYQSTELGDFGASGAFIPDGETHDLGEGGTYVAEGVTALDDQYSACVLISLAVTRDEITTEVAWAFAGASSEEGASIETVFLGAISDSEDSSTATELPRRLVDWQRTE